jgi:hypothetical protein
MQTRSESFSVLSELRSTQTAWYDRLAFDDIDDFEDHHRTRCLVLLALHAEPESAIADLPLACYLLDQETRQADETDSYRSALSLACGLLARTRVLENGTFFDIWVARHSNFDASVCVDTHWLYYLAGGLDAAQAYIENITTESILSNAGASRNRWWKWMLAENSDDEQQALRAVKSDILKRIIHDRKYLTDETIIKFVEDSWRTNTNEWASSLLDQADCE